MDFTIEKQDFKKYVSYVRTNWLFTSLIGAILSMIYLFKGAIFPFSIFCVLFAIIGYLCQRKRKAMFDADLIHEGAHSLRVEQIEDGFVWTDLDRNVSLEVKKSDIKSVTHNSKVCLVRLSDVTLLLPNHPYILRMLGKGGTEWV